MARYPEVSVDMVLNDRSVDLIEEGFDAAIRVGHSADSSLVARHLATVHFVACTTPEYVARHGASTALGKGMASGGLPVLMARSQFRFPVSSKRMMATS